MYCICHISVTNLTDYKLKSRITLLEVEILSHNKSVNHLQENCHA